MDVTRTYAINNSSIDVRIGDLLDSTCEVVVSSDDCMVSQGGRGIGAQIAEKGGEGIAADARKKTPAELGGVVVTTAGELGQKYVFHAITIDFYKRLKERAATDEESRDIQAYIVKNSVRKCMRLAAALDVHSIAFPVIGTGAAGIPFEKAVRCMADVFMEELSRTNREMRIELWLYRGFERHEPVDFIPVFEIFAEMRGRAAVAVQDVMPEVADNEQLDAGSSFGSASSEAANEVFISYSRKDLESDALRLVRRVLDGLKMPYWIDVDGNYSGRNYKGVIVQAIRRANLVIFMSSGNSNRSENVVKEIDIAAKAGKTILPVMVDMCPYDDRIAYDLASIDYIDVSKPSAVDRLREALLLSRINAANGSSCGGGLHERRQEMRTIEPLLQQLGVSSAPSAVGCVIIDGVVAACSDGRGCRVPVHGHVRKSGGEEGGIGKMKRALTCGLVVLAMASAMAATRRPKYSNSRARDAGAIMQGIGGLIGGLSEATSRQQQQQLEYQRQRQAELQRQHQEAERLERQRNLEIQQRQYELEKQRLALDRQRWREEADKQGIEICGYMIPSWLWQSIVASAVFGVFCLLLKCMFGRRS